MGCSGAPNGVSNVLYEVPAMCEAWRAQRVKPGDQRKIWLRSPRLHECAAAVRFVHLTDKCCRRRIKSNRYLHFALQSLQFTHWTGCPECVADNETAVGKLITLRQRQYFLGNNRLCHNLSFARIKATTYHIEAVNVSSCHTRRTCNTPECATIQTSPPGQLIIITLQKSIFVILAVRIAFVTISSVE